jgi:hypothetical protein
MGDGTVSNESDGYDPFAVFQAMADGPSSRELYGEFADLRAKASVHEGVHVGRREADGTTGDIPLDVTTWGPRPKFHDGERRGGPAGLGQPRDVLLRILRAVEPAVRPLHD